MNLPVDIIPKHLFKALREGILQLERSLTYERLTEDCDFMIRLLDNYDTVIVRSGLYALSVQRTRTLVRVVLLAAQNIELEISEELKKHPTLNTTLQSVQQFSYMVTRTLSSSEDGFLHQLCLQNKRDELKILLRQAKADASWKTLKGCYLAAHKQTAIVQLMEACVDSGLAITCAECPAPVQTVALEARYG